VAEWSPLLRQGGRLGNGDEIQSPCPVSAASGRCGRSTPSEPCSPSATRRADELVLTFDELGDAAERVAAELYGKGLRRATARCWSNPPSPGLRGRAGGCLALGVIPVPVCPPNPFTLRYDLEAFALVRRAPGTGRAHQPHVRQARTSSTDSQPWPMDPVAAHRSRDQAEKGVVARTHPHWTNRRCCSTRPARRATPRGVMLIPPQSAPRASHNARDLGLDTEARACRGCRTSRPRADLLHPQRHDRQRPRATRSRR